MLPKLPELSNFQASHPSLILFVNQKLIYTVLYIYIFALYTHINLENGALAVA